MIKESSKKGFFALRNNYLPAIITALFLLTSLIADAQVYQRDPSYGRDVDRHKARKVQLIPTFCGTPTLISTDSTAAAIAFDSCNHRFYFFDPVTKDWDTTGGGGGIPPTRIWLDSVRRAVGTDSVYEYYSSQATDGRRFAFLAPETSGITSDQTEVAIEDQEDFTFTDVPSSFDDFLLFRNAMELEPTTHFTKSGNTISIVIPMYAGDRIRLKRIK